MSGEKLPTPLDVLLVTMHRKWQAGDHDGAASLARVAAPYLHARRLAARHANDVETMDDAELDALCRLADRLDSGPAEGQGGAGAAADAAEQPGQLG